MVDREPLLWVNGRLEPVSSRHVSARDRGWTLGDGVFETVRVQRGRLVLWDCHIVRLLSGARLLGVNLSWSESDITEAAHETLQANNLCDAALRLTVTRGVPAARGLLPDQNASSMLVLDAYPFSGYAEQLYASGMRAVTSSVRRNEHTPTSRVKSLSYLDNVLARMEAERAGAHEALFLNTSGAVACASAANLFLVIRGQLTTPDLASGPLPGTVRAAVLEHLAAGVGLESVERRVMPKELSFASEAFLTSSLLAVMPLCSVDGEPIGDGRPGPVTRLIHDAVSML